MARFAYDDQIASIPAVMREIIERTDIPPLDPAHSIVFAGIGTSLNAARVAPPHPLLRPFLAILPFHRLTAELARVLGTDPDTLHGHREPWKTVMTGLRL